MTIRSTVLALMLATSAGATLAATPAASLGPLQQPLWLRNPAISPDGSQIAFGFQGHLFVVPTQGGAARVLVANSHHNTQPVWSPDGQHIAYASDAHGSFDVMLVSAQGGPSRRLTHHSASELPASFTPDGRHVLFSAARADNVRNVQFPSRAVTELYKVSVEGGRRPEQVLTTPALAAQLNAAGTQLLYEDWKGYEDDLRKHHVSPVARDVWRYDLKTGQHQQLTRFGGEDRNPVWSPDEQTVYFLSEKSGSFNVWKMPVSQPDAAVQVTQFSKNPVRSLSIARNGTLSFWFDGEIYTLAPGAAKPTKLALSIAVDTQARAKEAMTLRHGATEVALSPDGQEMAFVVRGEVFVASTEFGDTRRITDTAGQERSVSFSPDGRRLIYAAERGGVWGLMETTLVGNKKDVPYFFSATQFKSRTVLSNAQDNFQPRYSPDGKEVAYLENRNTLKVLNLASGQSRVVMPGSATYSYADGDQWFDWSPDGRHLLVNFVDRNRWSMEVGLVDAQGKGAMLNLTQSGYEDVRPIWAMAGQMMIWASDRMGFHATGGAAEHDIYALFFTKAAQDRFKLDKTDFALLKKREDEQDKADADKKDKADAKPSKAKKGEDKAGAAADSDEIKLPAALNIERERIEERTARLTTHSAVVRDAAMSKDGETLLTLQQAADGVELWLHKPRAKESRKLSSFAGGPNPEAPTLLVLDASTENGVVLSGGVIHKFKVPKDEGEFKAEPLKWAASLNLDRAAERAEMFEHVWRQTKAKLYVEDMNGVDWEGYKKIYARQLPYVNNNHDFADLLSEMLGELNVSHTGASFRVNRRPADTTAELGAFFDETHRGPGLKIAEILDGGPLAQASLGLKPGMVIEQIDGVLIAAGAEVDSLLTQKIGQRMRLTVRDPATGKATEHSVKPIHPGEQEELLYRRWVRQQRETVDKLSGGRLGYVHVRGMDDESYRDVFSEVMGRHSGKQALIVDTRFNGGGNLTMDLVTLLSGRKHLEFLPRGQSLGWEPAGKWHKPSLVLMSESNYSDAHLFPWTYRHYGLGKLVGMPVAGTGTAVWWETLQDPSLVFGIPQVGFRDQKGEFMENALVEPDVRVANDPALLAQGRDQQLEAAVKELLKAP
ncbi:S41 family peptidase [Ideonella sp.]|jgi:Tol biopolymer transport system component/C-terminal processing protease CtpA/Prc|uniref:S41 family peptidase n=1 Tax=Ideonella sp. TaxID=1929293 RepID=UPI0037BF1FDE